MFLEPEFGITAFNTRYPATVCDQMTPQMGAGQTGDALSLSSSSDFSCFINDGLCLARNAVYAADVTDLQARIGLFEDREDLGFGKS